VICRRSELTGGAVSRLIEIYRVPAGKGLLERRDGPADLDRRGDDGKHVHGILGKLDLPDSSGDHRRVLGVLAYLSSTES
jgi:hypothetical protein